MVENIHALTARSGTWQETTELVGKLKTDDASQWQGAAGRSRQPANLRLPLSNLLNDISTFMTLAPATSLSLERRPALAHGSTATPGDIIEVEADNSAVLRTGVVDEEG